MDISVKMHVHHFIVVIFTLYQNPGLADDIKKLFYEKDLSEHCKRRVIPSIFLGRHVVEASAFILHFTRLELPYSCFISVRSESGSNMIMVIQMEPEAGLERSCSYYSPQLLVYEMGETFGGYWGPFPESMINQGPPGTKVYTQKTTPPTTMSIETTTTEKSIETTPPTTTPNDGSTESEDFIRVEVPIVEVSGQLVPGGQHSTQAFDVEQAFDLQYDVTPIPGEKYDTSILPLVQLSVRKQPVDGRRDEGQEPLYDLDVIEQFTPDSRLTLRRYTPSNPYNQKQNINANKRLRFGKDRTTKSPFHKKISSTRLPSTRKNKFTKYAFPTTTRSSIKGTMDHVPDSWEMIDKLMAKLNKNKEHEIQEGNVRASHKTHGKNTSRIKENISNMKHNFSIYLAPNLSIYNDYIISSDLFPITTKRMTISTTRSFAAFMNFTNESDSETAVPRNNLQEVTKGHPSDSLQQSQTTDTTTNYICSDIVSAGINTIYERQISSSPNLLSNGTVPPITLVDHESWENIVQAAPGMAVLLNRSIPYDITKQTKNNFGGNASAWSSLNETYRKILLERKKREIHAISIENARPRNLSTKRGTAATTKMSYNLVDMQEFVRMVEIQDDDMHGRIALRYLRQYVGPALYNICADAQPYSRHVYLFNSSRIVLALNNFTLNSMSVILTGATTLLNGEMRCSDSQLECQVSGARVCVDSLAACDGVPNCGSYDIYDEDRLMCGAVKGLQHNVYLAAFTFLALLLTLFYGVHYWLKRCIPKVADAFFVYMDGVENTLYLDTIMRHPGEVDDTSKMFYHGNMFSGAKEELMEESHKGFCSRLFSKCFGFCFQKKKVKEKDEGIEHEMFTQIGHRKTYSFTQMEICKMLAKSTAVDTSVQTGDSLEMKLFEEISSLQVTRNRRSIIKETKENDAVKTKVPPIMIKDSLITLDEPLPEDELSLMKFFRDSRSNSSESMIKERYQETKIDFVTGAAPGGEREISSIMYDGGIKVEPGPSGIKSKRKTKVKPKVQSHTRDTRKRLRFDEATTTIPSKEISDDEDEDEDDVSSGHHRKILSLGTRTWRNQNLGTIKEDNEQGSSKPRHFWESKGKKTKKKINVSLR